MCLFSNVFCLFLFQYVLLKEELGVVWGAFQLITLRFAIKEEAELFWSCHYLFKLHDQIAKWGPTSHPSVKMLLFISLLRSATVIKTPNEPITVITIISSSCHYSCAQLCYWCNAEPILCTVSPPSMGRKTYKSHHMNEEQQFSADTLLLKQTKKNLKVIIIIIILTIWQLLVNGDNHTTSWLFP